MRARSVLLAAMMALALAAPADAAVYRFPAVADTYVSAAEPGTGHGTANILKVDGMPLLHAYVRFEVAGLDAPVRRATLSVFSHGNSTVGVTAHRVAPADWTEADTTWLTAPPLGEVVGVTGPLLAASRPSIDVTPLVTGDGRVDIGLSTLRTQSIHLGSRQVAEAAPELIVETEPAPPPEPTPEPTPEPSPDPTAEPTPEPSAEPTPEPTPQPTPQPTPEPTPTPTPTPPPSRTAVIAAAGDIACDTTHPNYNGGRGTAQFCRHFDTANLVGSRNVDAVFALGDLQYERGELASFRRAYEPSWGRFKSITRPVPGNHDQEAGYYDYWGAQAGPRGKGYYSFDIGAWHVVALNGNCQYVPGGCGVGSPQERWLRADLAANPSRCLAAISHQALYSSDPRGGTTALRPLWQAIQDAGGDLVISAHDHQYERFAPQDANGRLDPVNGMPLFIIGTGGGSWDTTPLRRAANSVVVNERIFGVGFFTLRESGYDWTFEPLPGSSFRDAGSGTCD